MKGQVILKNLRWLGRHNPAFTPGSVQTAVAELLNPTSSILPYSARLCLNKPGMLCTGKVFFNIEAGKTKSIYFSTEVPTVEGTYPVYLDVFSNGQLLKTYRADEDVVIGVIYTLTWSVTPSGSGTISPASGTKYPSATTVTLKATASLGYEFDHWGGAASGTSRTTTIVMSKNQWVVAYFKEVAPVYICPYCRAKFTNESELGYHIATQHPYGY